MHAHTHTNTSIKTHTHKNRDNQTYALRLQLKQSTLSYTNSPEVQNVKDGASEATCQQHNYTDSCYYQLITRVSILAKEDKNREDSKKERGMAK